MRENPKIGTMAKRWEKERSTRRSRSMPRFLFTESSQRFNRPKVPVDVEPANAEPESFEAIACHQAPTGRFRKYELVDEDGCQKAFVSYRERF
jgi:hypothetical protein